MTVRGEMSPAALASWAHTWIGHDGPELAQELVDLDDVHDSLEHCSMTETDFQTAVLVAARRVEVAPEPSCSDGQWPGLRAVRAFAQSELGRR